MISFLEASEEGQGFLKLILDSALDIAEDWFESEEMKALFLLSTGAALIPPYTKGTGQFSAAFAGVAFHGALPEGGSEALTKA
jgi:phytoene dehydrogenase-like protein